jgi:hypothetical protein
MAASFIKKSDGNFYLRLTGDTRFVKFAAASNASRTYVFKVHIPSQGGYPERVISINKSLPDGQNYRNTINYTISANPNPGGTLVSPENGFSGAEEPVDFPGSGTRYFLLSFTDNTNVNDQHTFYLGGEFIVSNYPDRVIYAYPGSTYLSNSLDVRVKNDGYWKSVKNMFIKYNGSWREVGDAYIKQGWFEDWREYGEWKIFNKYKSSSWINMNEEGDDPLDFAVQVIPTLWFFPYAGSNEYHMDFVDDQNASSLGTSSLILSPVSQTVTLYIELLFESEYWGTSPSSYDAYASILLINTTTNNTIWSHNTGFSISPTNYTETFQVSEEQSYRFESYTYVSNYRSANHRFALARVRRDNSQGVIIYSNKASWTFVVGDNSGN